MPSPSSLSCSTVSCGFWPEIPLTSPNYSPSAVSSVFFYSLSLKFSFRWNMVTFFFLYLSKRQKDGQGWIWKWTESHSSGVTALINSLSASGDYSHHQGEQLKWRADTERRRETQQSWETQQSCSQSVSCNWGVLGALSASMLVMTEFTLSSTQFTVWLYEFTKLYTYLYNLY